MALGERRHQTLFASLGNSFAPVSRIARLPRQHQIRHHAGAPLIQVADDARFLRLFHNASDAHQGRTPRALLRHERVENGLKLQFGFGKLLFDRGAGDDACAREHPGRGAVDDRRANANEKLAAAAGIQPAECAGV